MLDQVVVDDVLMVDRATRGLELHLHGSPAVIDLLAIRFGEPRIPAVSAADELLQRAISREQLHLALEQRAFDVPAYLRVLAGQPAEWQRRELELALQRSRVAMAHVLPCRLVLVGRQNAGKSTLFNRLLFRERALAGPVAGLTRDPISDAASLDGYPYEIVDTAGEGHASSPVDQRAMDRAHVERARGDLVILVVDGSVGPSAIDHSMFESDVLVVATKGDLPQAHWPPELRLDATVACADTAGSGLVRAAIGALLRDRRCLPPAGPVGGPAALCSGDLNTLQQLASAAGLPRA